MADGSNSTILSGGKFMEALLHPLPDEALLDFEYSLLMRRARKRYWLIAAAITRYQDAKFRMVSEECLLAFKSGDSAKRDSLNSKRVKALIQWRAAVAAQICTPAPDLSAVKWKQRAAEKDPYIPVSKQEISKAVAADMAWLAAHPVACRRKKSTG